MVPASFEDIEEADNIRIDICPRMVDAVADAGLSRQIDDDIRMKRRKKICSTACSSAKSPFTKVKFGNWCKISRRASFSVTS